MAKKNFNKGIDNVFSSTVKVNEIKETEEVKETLTGEGTSGRKGEGTPSGAELEKQNKTTKTEDTAATSTVLSTGIVGYNIRYSKELQKKIKRFCIENDIDMKDVFTQGAIMYMEKFRC